MQRFTTCLWFDNQAEEAVVFYTSIFKNSGIGRRTFYTNEGFELHGKPAGSLCTIEFSMNGSQFLALNGGPLFKFNEAVSLVINCDSQEEVDYYWEKLSEGGDPESRVCGWLKDKYGLSWQIVPVEFMEMVSSGESEKVERVMKYMLRMKKLDMGILRKAFDGALL